MKNYKSKFRAIKKLAWNLWAGWLMFYTLPVKGDKLYQPTWSFFFFFLIFLVFNFTILYWFCHTLTWICHRYTRAPHPEPSSLLPPCTVPLSRPTAPAPSIQYRASNLTGGSFHIWYYTCFNAILPNYPTLSLSHRVQKTVLYISVSFTWRFLYNVYKNLS